MLKDIGLLKKVSTGGFEDLPSKSKQTTASSSTKADEEISQETLFGPEKEGSTDTKAEAALEKVEFEHSKRFNDIVDQVRIANIANNILKKINFKGLQSDLLEILAKFSGQEKMEMADRHIIYSALALWSASLIENQQLIDEFYTWSRPNAKEDDIIKSAEQLIITLIFNQKGLDPVRQAAQANFELICEKVTKNNGKRPLFYFIEILQNTYPKPVINDKTKLGDSTWVELKEMAMKESEEQAKWYANCTKEDQHTATRLITA